MSQSPTIHDVPMGKRLYLVRKFLKLNQTEMADLCQVSQPMITFMEKGVREIPVSVLKILFLQKNISPVYIVAGVAEMEYISKVGTTIGTQLREMRVELEILKAEVSRLKQVI